MTPLPLPAGLTLILFATASAALTAQNGVPNQAAFALRVAKAHQHGEQKQKITSFVTTIDLELKDATKDKGGHVALDVAFLEFHRYLFRVFRYRRVS